MNPQENNNQPMSPSDAPIETSAAQTQNTPADGSTPTGASDPQTTASPQNNAAATPNYAQQPYPVQPPVSFQYPVFQSSAHTMKLRENAEKELKAGKTVTMLLMTFIFGFLVGELLLHGGVGLSITILGFIFCFVTFWYVRKKEVQPGKASVPLMLFNLMLFSAYFLVNSTVVWIVDFFLLAIFIPLWLVELTGRGNGNLFSLRTYFSALADQLESTFTFLTKPFAAFSPKKGTGFRSKSLLYAIIGVILSLPVVAIFISLYSAADEVFEAFILNALTFLNIDFGWLIADIVIGAIICLFVSAWLFGAKIWENREKKEASEDNGSLPAALVTSFLFLIVTVNAAFMAIQFKYFFSKELPNDMTIASFAKRGFYELVVAAVIITFLVGLSLVLTKRGGNGEIHTALKVVLTLMTLSGSVLLCSAINKMLFYIQIFSSTILRISVLWLIALLAMIFLGLFIRIWVKKVRLVRFAAVSLIVLAVLFNISNPDWLVAKINVDLYLNDKSDSRSIDTDYLEGLTCSAVPELVRLEGSIPDYQYNRLISSHRQRLNYGEKWKRSTLADYISYFTIIE